MNKKLNRLPYLNISLGITLLYLSIIVIIPIVFLFYRGSLVSVANILDIISEQRTLQAFKVTFYTSLIAALINSLMGLTTAWILVRYKFPGQQIIDSLIDIPFALPTAIAGIALTTLYAPDSFLGKLFLSLGIKISYTPIGIIVALIFVSLPFSVRTIQPILEDLNLESEEAAISLGASRLQTFYLIILPNILPGIITGFTLTFARCLGEYGSIIFISGNIPMFSEIVPYIIFMKLEQFNYDAAIIIGLAMLIISFCLLLIINSLQKLVGKLKYQ